jgi:DNA primase small subunit
MYSKYWQHAFPAETVHRLFARNWQPGGPAPERREYGIETHPDAQYRRWFDCARVEDLRKFVQHPKFGKLNVGAMMDQRPSLRWKCLSGHEPKPVLAELRIDIDQDDYDRAGISKNDLAECDAMFALVGVGLEVCMDVLRSEFGFEHMLPVYSGRRGGHLWVCDKRACMLSDEGRRAIVDFLKPGQKVHTSGRRTFRWLLQYPAFGGPDNPMQKHGVFSRIVYKFFRGRGVRARHEGGLGLLDVGFDRADFLKMIDDRFHTDNVTAVRSAATGYDALLVIEKALRQKPKEVKEWLVPRFCETVCTLLWPRVDEAVTTHMNHTLKAPFSVHPKTGRVSVPMLGKQYLWDFDPATEAPLASAQMPASFGDIVQRTNAFIQTLAHSSTESWQPPDLSILEPPPKRMRYDVTVGTSSDGTPILSDTKRVAWVVHRMIAVYVDDEGVAHYEISTRSYDHRPSIVILPHHYPPFKDCGPLQRMITSALSALAEARAMLNTAYAVHSWEQIVVVDADVQSEVESLKKANARFERLRERLAEGSGIGEAKATWTDAAHSRFVEDQLWTIVEELRSL